MVSDVSLSEAHVAAADAVREFYDGEEGALFSLVFGEQIQVLLRAWALKGG